MAKKKSKKAKKVSRKSTTGGKKWKPTYDGKTRVSGSTWGMVRETFKRTKRDKVFVNAKKVSEGVYDVYYRNRTKKTTRPPGSATSAVEKIWKKKKVKKVKKKAKKTSKKKKTAKKKKTSKKKKATKKRKR